MERVKIGMHLDAIYQVSLFGYPLNGLLVPLLVDLPLSVLVLP